MDNIIKRLISVKDQKIRKKWLWVSLSLYIFVPVFLYIIFLPLTSPDENCDGSTFMLVAIYFAAFYALYHCAYEKAGNKFLKFELYITTIQMGVFILNLLMHPSLAVFISALVTIPLGIWWIKSGWALVEVNKRIKGILKAK